MTGAGGGCCGAAIEQVFLVLDPGGAGVMTFQSILFEKVEDSPLQDALDAPDYFGDLNLDQVIDAITAGRQEYHLKPFFYTPLHTLEAISYRHDIMRDLDHQTLLEQIRSFAQKLRTMREYLSQAQKLHYKYQKDRWFLDAVDVYCKAVTGLARDLSVAPLQSRGFLAFRQYLTAYVNADAFTNLQRETKQLKADLSEVHYCLLITGNRVRVRRYDAELDYSVDVTDTFEKFKQGAVKDYRVKLSAWPDMNHVEAQILGLVAKLYPDVFSHLDEYRAKHDTYLDKTLADFDREIQFYLAYLEYMARFKREGLSFCFPRLSVTSKEVSVHEGYDVALAGKLLAEHSPIICNDFSLSGQERILVVTGPNQGGKTTFARTFGQTHYLASIGCPVPGREAQLFLFDQMFTHFEKEEAIQDLRSKLEDDLLRMARIVNQTTANSVIILNEIFTSTTVHDAVFLSKNILEKIIQLDALGVWVTFIDEIAAYSAQTVSMVSTIVPENPALRTYHVVRRPADGLAYALAIAEKYRLTYDKVKERIPS
jgi:DNA mismatch repair protein MutS